MATSKFTLHDLIDMLKNLGVIAASATGRKMLIEQLEASIRRSKIGGTLLDKVKLMYAFFRDPAEPTKQKVMIGAALLYLVIPSDLIPDWVALIGFADDFAAIAYVWNQSKDILLNYEKRRAARLNLAE